MKKWLLKKLGFIIDIFRPEEIKGLKYNPRFLPPEQGKEYAAMLDAKIAKCKKIKIKPVGLELPHANLQHEIPRHTTVHSQQTPLVRTMQRRANIQQTVREIQAKIYRQYQTNSGTSI